MMPRLFSFTHILLIIFSIMISITFTTFSYAANEVNTNKKKLAIKGYDPVAYFTQGKAVKGDKQYMAKHKKALYYFSSVEHRALFEKNPNAYLPQYGGYCAFGVTKEKKYKTDPTAWKIVDDKLYLNLNHKVQNIWEKKIPEYIAEAEEIWPDIRKKKAKKLNRW